MALTSPLPEPINIIPPGITLVMYMGISKNSGTPKWMVSNGKPY